MSLIVALLLTWTAPVLNCSGSALTDLAGYQVQTERIVRTGIRIDPDGSQWDIATRAQSTVMLPASATSLSLADPDVGGMIAYRVAAVDLAGNVSCGMEVPTP